MTIKYCSKLDLFYIMYAEHADACAVRRRFAKLETLSPIVETYLAGLPGFPSLPSIGTASSRHSNVLAGGTGVIPSTATAYHQKNLVNEKKAQG